MLTTAASSPGRPSSNMTVPEGAPAEAPGAQAEGHGGHGAMDPGVPMESMHHTATDGKERNYLHPASPFRETVSCMDNVTAKPLKFSSFRLRHQFKVKCGCK